MTDTQINKASWEFVDSLHETNQAVADHFVAVLDRNLQFAQTLFLLGIGAMESQAKTTRHLINQWTHQLPKQQKAFYGLMNATLDVYLDFLRLPFSSSQTGVSEIAAATQRTLQFTRQVAQQTIEAAGTGAPREQAQLWTFEHQLEEADNQRPVRIQAKGPGMVHAGVNCAGKWIRMYDMPLQEVSLGVWEAVLHDPEVNEFTFIWYDPDGSGSVHWEGKNYLLPRRSLSKEDAAWPLEKSIKKYLAQQR